MDEIHLSNRKSKPSIIEILRKVADDSEDEDYKTFFGEDKETITKKKKWERKTRS